MTAELIYLGGLRTEAVHSSSKTKVIFDAPIDNHGKGESFSPTDMASVSLSACMMTIMGIAANAHSIDMDGTKATVTKIMNPSPRKISEIRIQFEFPEKTFSKKEKKILENAALSCPVGLSLSQELIQNTTFKWPSDPSN